MANMIKQFAKSRTADDTDPALNFIYKDGTATYTVDSNAGGTGLQLVAGGVTSTFLYATYTTLGALIDAVRAVDGWEMSTIIGRRANLTAGLLDNSGPVTGTEAGVTIFFDTSTCLFRSMAVGVEELNVGYGTALWTDGNQPFVRDPTYNNTGANQSGSIWNTQTQAFIQFAQARVTAAGTITATITECDQYNDYDSIVSAAPITTATLTQIVDQAKQGTIYATVPGRRLVFQIGDGTNAPTSGLINAVGGLITPGQMISAAG